MCLWYGSSTILLVTDWQQRDEEHDPSTDDPCGIKYMYIEIVIDELAWTFVYAISPVCFHSSTNVVVIVKNGHKNCKVLPKPCLCIESSTGDALSVAAPTAAAIK